jgi:hypothetical protein
VQGVSQSGDRDEAEGVGEPLRGIEVRLLELQPRQVLDLDHRVLRPPGAVTPLGALLAVQVFVRRLRIHQNDPLIETDSSIKRYPSPSQGFHQH